MYDKSWIWMLLPIGSNVISTVSLIFLHLLEFIIKTDGNSYESYAVVPRTCKLDSHCNFSIGEVCWKQYNGCSRGVCKCSPSAPFNKATRTCHPVKFGGDHCTYKDTCPDGMICRGGLCLCLSGIMTPDRLFCLQNNEKLLGQTCSTRDICYQRNAFKYTSEHMVCSDYICRCESGYKVDGLTCAKWNILEKGCSENHQCQGGALCIDHICKCPTNYMPGAGNSKCVLSRAHRDLKKGGVCDEVHESSYCGEDLICHRCHGDMHHTCVSYDNLPIWQYLNKSHKSSISSLTLTISLLVFVLNSKVLFDIS